jgi:hypothetical protein
MDYLYNKIYIHVENHKRPKFVKWMELITIRLVYNFTQTMKVAKHIL